MARELKVVDWAQGGWFLLESADGEVFLDMRVSYGAFDGSALIGLSDEEVARWRGEGVGVIHDLAREIYEHYYDTPAPGAHSVWWERDLYRTERSREVKSAFQEAIRAWPPWIAWKAQH